VAHAVILATWEAEIGRTMVRGQLRQRVKPESSCEIRVCCTGKVTALLAQWQRVPNLGQILCLMNVKNAALWHWTRSLLREKTNWALVAHACNPSYSEGRDQEDHSSKPAWPNTSRDPIWKKKSQKKGWWSGSRCRPWVQVPVPQKKEEKKREREKRHSSKFPHETGRDPELVYPFLSVAQAPC
jgi:hypothetical protein